MFASPVIVDAMLLAILVKDVILHKRLVKLVKDVIHVNLVYLVVKLLVILSKLANIKN